MRSALICLFFAFIVKEGSRADEFRPTPIPLNEWHEVRDGRDYEEAGTLHEATYTVAPSTVVAAIPAHYWEDALRHSVYLTLVRDKIDELIAKGDVIAPDSKPDTYINSDVDDHDLWEKIKTAPFDRVEGVEHLIHGDVEVMAKGRLLEENGRFRFTQDNLDKEDCMDEKCKNGIKAIWSVKRVRQREVETSPGKYHYELTFSVVSQFPKEKRKPHTNPVRTFTVRETTPEKVIDMPQENIRHKRPQRVVWFHRNLSPYSIHNEGRQHKNGLERLFSSLFSDDDEDYVPPPRYRKVVSQYPYNPPYNQQHGPPHTLHPSLHSKVGYVGSPSDQQKRVTPSGYKPGPYKYSRPIPPPYIYGPKPPHLESESVGASYSTPHVLTTKPAFLPTPVSPSNKSEEEDKRIPHVNENTTRPTDVITGKPYSRPGPLKINYLPDHVRPPVYNAPPGVFVTLDKKPFKPLPPLKLKVKGYNKGYPRPLDFRPSPQVLDMQQFSEPDPFVDTAFRPITWNYQSTNTTEKPTASNVTDATTASSIPTTEKIQTKGKKPPKKHENIKSQLTTSAPPEIITATSSFSEEQDETLGWANIVGAFVKTTPMASQKEKTESTSEPTTSSTSTTETTTAARRRTTSTTEAEKEEPTTTTTAKPKRRTRPPPKFSKPDRIKKHKRVTTTTTTQAPESNKTTHDLTPQASSASATKPTKTTTEKMTSTAATTTAKPTTPSTTTTKPTTPRPTTTRTTTETPRTTEPTEPTSSTTQPKIKNRFRQSTLLQKGTSVNHDKWTIMSLTTKPTSTVPSVFPPRRKGSNFQGHATRPPSKMNDREHNVHHADKVPLNVQPLNSVAEDKYRQEVVEREYLRFRKDSEEEDDDDDNDDDDDHDDDVDEDENDDEHREFIFGSSSSGNSDQDNEIVDSESITTEIMPTPIAQKNMTKCQKKKLLNSSSTTEQPSTTTLEANSTVTNTAGNHTDKISESVEEKVTTPSFLDEILKSFSDDDHEHETHKYPRLVDLDHQESESQSHFVKLDDDLQDFLDSLDKGHKQVTDEDDVVDYGDDDEESDDSPIDKWEQKVTSRQSDYSDEEEYHNMPHGIFELLSME